MHVMVYSKPGCHLCEDVLQVIDRLTVRYGLDVIEVNVLDDMAIYEQYREIIPVVEVTDAPVGRLVVPISESALRAYFRMAEDAVKNREPVSIAQPYAEQFMAGRATSADENSEKGFVGTPGPGGDRRDALQCVSTLQPPSPKESWLDRVARKVGWR
jgi:glutaredoxin